MKETMKTRFLFLQLFADGGAGDATGAESGATESDAAAQSGEKLPITYLDEEVTQEEPVAEASQEAEEPDIAAEFDALIGKGGKYADEFQKRFKTALDGRFKQNKEQSAELEQSRKVMQKLAQVYGKDPTDIEGIGNALDADDGFYAAAAEKEGLSVETFRELSDYRAQEAVRKRMEAENQERVNMQKDFDRWTQEAEGMKGKYPDFDFFTEFENNELFGRLLLNGISVENAYRSANFEKILKAETEEAKANIAKSYAANRNRPDENAGSNNAAATAKRDVASLTDEELDEIDRLSRKRRITL